VFGPLQPTRTRIVLDYPGLLDHPAGEVVDIADRHNFTTRAVSNNVATVRAAGTRIPLSRRLITEATRPSTRLDDHLSRVRIATTLGLPAPPAGAVDESAPVGTVRPGHLTAPGARYGYSPRSARWTYRHWPP